MLREVIDMAVSNIKAVFQSDVQKVWKIVTDVKNYPIWRSDLIRTDVYKRQLLLETTGHSALA